MNARPSLAALAVVALAMTAPAQEYRWEEVTAAGLRLKCHKKLKPVPMELGEEKSVLDLHRRARFEPKSRQQFIMKGSQPFNWGLDVYEFKKPKVYKDKPKDQAELRRRNIEKRKFDAGARNFVHFITDKYPGSDSFKWFGKGGKEGKKQKAKKKLPESWIYEYAMADKIDDANLPFHWYYYARNYKLPDREIALVFSWPIFKDKPDSKHLKIAKSMTGALEVLASSSASAVDANAEKDQFANTPERKAVLDAAVQGIRGIDGWDYYTTESCLVLYSWKPKSNKQAKALATAKPIVDHFEGLQKLYREEYPPHDKMKSTYPVLRICYDRHTMRLYGSPPVRAESFFNPSSGEVVIMLGGDRDAKELAAAEGWYQYAHAYFRGAKTGGWLAHGLAEYFACYKKAGKKWVYAPSKFRINGPDGVKTLFKKGDNAGLSEFLRYHDDKYLGDEDNEDFAKWRAQAYSLVSMLKRGKSKLKGKWDEGWTKLLPTYVETIKKTKSSTKAMKATFDTIDKKAFESAWKSWSTSHITKK